LEALHGAGWRVGIVWECALKGRERRPVEDVLNAVSDWLTSSNGDLTVEGVLVTRTAEPAI
jgi:DNA mismatch endonuclease, patch repair protein